MIPVIVTHPPQWLLVAAVGATAAAATVGATVAVSAGASVAEDAEAADVADAEAVPASERQVDKSSLMTKLETTTHLFLIGLCCLAGGLLIEQRFFRPPEAETVSPRDLVGRAVELPGADWQAAPFSVLLQISSTCHFCNESMPFYKQLMAARQSQAARIPVIVASGDAVSIMRKYLEDHQVIVDKVLHSRLQSFRTGTPTIYIVDSKGLVRRAFIGELDSSGEKELLSIIERGKV